MRDAIGDLFSTPRNTRDHFHTVDLLRGIAALAVVLFHYLNFFIPPGQQQPVGNFLDLEPLRDVFWPAYHYGLWAVQLFWLISGFVFAAVYVDTAVSARAFAIARIARLYPLHLLTLFVVAGLQFWRLWWLGNFQIFQFNDLYHFILNLFFASSWGFERGLSFNGPIWSVSVEVAIYAVFWVTLKPLYRFGVLGPLALACLFTTGSIFDLPGTVFWQCGFYFFTGSAIYVAFSFLRRSPWLFFVAGLASLAAAILAALHVPFEHLMPVIIPGLFLIACGVEAAGWVRSSRWTELIANNTYGVYLWHIPVQLGLMLILDGVVGDRAAVSTGWFLLLYLGLVIVIARLSYLNIERPAGQAIRRLSARRPGAPA
jgi:peptidoglycan/LPS O-acetylase OafA/YrhL